MSDRDVLALRVNLSRLAQDLSRPRTERDDVQLAVLLQLVRDEADAALAAFGGR